MRSRYPATEPSLKLRRPAAVAIAAAATASGDWRGGFTAPYIAACIFLVAVIHRQVQFAFPIVGSDVFAASSADSHYRRGRFAIRTAARTCPRVICSPFLEQRLPSPALRRPHGPSHGPCKCEEKFQQPSSQSRRLSPIFGPPTACTCRRAPSRALKSHDLVCNRKQIHRGGDAKKICNGPIGCLRGESSHLSAVLSSLWNWRRCLSPYGNFKLILAF